VARTAIAVNTLKGSANPANPGADLTLTAIDSANDHEWTLRDGDILLIVNNLGSPQSVTLVATADPHGRTEDATISTGANSFRVVGPLRTLGWVQSDGTVHLDSTGLSSMNLAVLRPPAA
jgi:hypothetical protein